MVPIDDNEIRHPLSLIDATRLINLYANSNRCKIIQSVHSNERADPNDRGVNFITILKTLKEGSVVSHREEKEGKWKGHWRYKVEYKDKYGCVYVVTAIPKPYSLVLVTVMRKDY